VNLASDVYGGVHGAGSLGEAPAVSVGSVATKEVLQKQVFLEPPAA
jgi:hypothetical protein